MAELDDEPDETLAAIDSGEPTASAESLAWAEDDSLDETPIGSWRAVLLRAAAVLAFCVLTAVGVVVVWRELPGTPPAAPPPSAATQTTLLPPPTKEAVANPTVVTTAMDSRAQKINPPNPDTVYLAQLDRANVHWTTEAEAIRNGHLVCRALDEGDSFQTIATHILNISAPSVTYGQVASAVGAAIYAYCPQHGE